MVDFVHAVAAGEQPTPSFQEGLHVQRVLDAVERSSAERSTWTPVETDGDPAPDPTGQALDGDSATPSVRENSRTSHARQNSPTERS